MLAVKWRKRDEELLHRLPQSVSWAVFDPVSRHHVCQISGAISRACDYAGQCSRLGVAKRQGYERDVAGGEPSCIYDVTRQSEGRMVNTCS